MPRPNTPANEQAGARALYLLILQQEYPTKCAKLWALEKPDLDLHRWGERLEAVVNHGYSIKDGGKAIRPEFALEMQAALAEIALEASGWAYPLVARILEIVDLLAWDFLKATTYHAATAPNFFGYSGDPPKPPELWPFDTREAFLKRSEDYYFEAKKFFRKNGIEHQQDRPELTKHLRWLAWKAVGKLSYRGIAQREETGEVGHTGVRDAVLRAVQFIGVQLG